MVFDKMNRNEVSSEGHWLYLTGTDQLNTIIDHSKHQPVIIYKHSTRCGLSSMIWRRLKNDEKRLKENAELYFLDLIRHRDVSDEVARVFNVRHESPQIIIVKNGDGIYHASHLEIDIGSIIEELEYDLKKN